MVRAVVAVMLLVLLPSVAHAEKRLALLIGNEAYAPAIGALANPHNDVALLEQALKGLGFEVTVERDAGLGALTRAVNAYARRLQAAGQNAVGLFYYSGHGASDGSTNYLIPIDVKTTEAGELWDQSLRLTEITRKLKAEAGNATHFVVFDACRNTLKLTQPGSRAVVQSKGFVPVAQENGMLIAYATAEGELASDVGTAAGPYAKALAEEIVKPGIEAVVMFRAVQRRVRAAIRQEPYLGFNALGDVYLAGLNVEPTKSDATPHAQPQASEASVEWARVDKTSVVELETFVRRNGSSVEADYARARLGELKKRQAVAMLQQQKDEKRRAEAEAALIGPAQRPAGAKYFKCAMHGGVMEGHVYSFSIDAAGRKVTWAEYGVPLDIVYMDDLRINTVAKLQISGWPEHDHISFNFNRLTLAVEASLGHFSTPEEILKCRATLKDPYCELADVVASSNGACELIARPEDIASNTPERRPDVVASPRLCDGVVATVGGENRCLRARDRFKDCPNCPEMVVVPTGSFMMGSNDGGADEKPVHKVTIAKPFAVGKFTVTFAEWDACVAAGGCTQTREDQGWGRGTRPVINVSWNDATEYARWLSRKTVKTYRLLTEAEWEYAARGVTSASAVHTAYSWGNDIGSNRANCKGCGSQWDRQTAPVGSFAANAFDLHDMHGNVGTWVQDCLHANYEGAPADGSVWTASCKDSSRRAVRGGSWAYYPQSLRVTYRDWNDTDYRNLTLGFRVARTL